jgi:hypothetical protein
VDRLLLAGQRPRQLLEDAPHPVPEKGTAAIVGIPRRHSIVTKGGLS